MPRGKLKVPLQVEYVSVLDPSGKLDAETDPALADDLLRALHRAMLRTRRFDERLLSLQRSGRIGTFAPVKGQEAAQLGAVAALEDSDWLVPSYRETAAMLWRGTPLAGILLFNAGYNEGAEIPEDRLDLAVAVPVASQLLHAVGLAYGMKYRRTKQVAMTFFGDGATSEGDFHEALNFAGVWQAPVVFICQNNQWAISVPRARQTRAQTLAQKALAYGIPGMQVDGNDILAVYVAARQAVDRARAGEGPTMIECITYRLEVHTTADDPTKYRTDEEVETWRQRDPLPRFQGYLRNRGLLDDDELAKLEAEIEEEMGAAWRETQARIRELDDPSVLFDHMYAETPPYLAEQRRTFQADRGGARADRRGSKPGQEPEEEKRSAADG